MRQPITVVDVHIALQSAFPNVTLGKDYLLRSSYEDEVRVFTANKALAGHLANSEYFCLKVRSFRLIGELGPYRRKPLTAEL